jgi:hypothetical protein
MTHHGDGACIQIAAHLAAIAAYNKLEAERDALRARLVFDRTDNNLPITKCLTLLNNGQISIGKAIEWLDGYISTGIQQPIADGIGPSMNGCGFMRASTPIPAPSGTL